MARPSVKKLNQNLAIDTDTSTKEGVVLTFDGTSAPKSKCRSINAMYYTVGDINVKNSGQCIMMPDEKYYRLSTNKIAWDHEKQCYNFISSMVKGITPDGIGYFTPDLAKNVDVTYSGDTEITKGFDESSVRKMRLNYSFQNGRFTDSERVSASRTYNGQRPQYTEFEYKVYGMSGHPQLDLVAKEFAKQEFPAHILDQYLYDYKIGLEAETDAGWLPLQYYFKHGCLPLYDGSIKATEVTTLPVSGAGTINNFIGLFDAMTKYTSATSNNSLHVNVGGVPNTPEFRVALYCLYFRLQQEINTFIPRYKRELSYLTGKAGGPKDHCQAMQHLGIVKRYNHADFEEDVLRADRVILSFLNEGKPVDPKNPRKHFREGQPKWEQQARYYALNLLPLYFGSEEASRIEYRVHSGTVNKYKSIIWILLCTAITKFAENNIERILLGKEKITLEDIISEMFEAEIANYIMSYITYRAEENTKGLIINGHNNIYGNEFEADHVFKFQTQSREQRGVVYDILNLN